MSAPPTRGGPQHIPTPPDAVPGRPAPWSELPDDRRRPDLEQIRLALDAGPAPAPSEAEWTSGPGASVLVPLYEHDDDVWVVLTRRAWHLRAHSGEVSFPGGRREAGDRDLWHTALRETWEEVGLDQDLPARIGELHHLATVTSQSSIVPYVGVLPSRPELRANDDEVDAILHVRLSELLLPEVYREERWRLGDGLRPIHFFELVGDTVWGATGSMLVDLLTRITGSHDGVGRAP